MINHNKQFLIFLSCLWLHPLEFSFIYEVRAQEIPGEFEMQETVNQKKNKEEKEHKAKVLKTTTTKEKVMGQTSQEDPKSPTMNDEEILKAVKNEITQDPFVSLDNLKIQVHQGVVTMGGTVPNFLARQRALHIAETVRGVSLVRDQLKVIPPKNLSPEDLEKYVDMQLYLNPATDDYEIKSDAGKNGEVVLTGQVDSWQEKILAEKVAQSVRGVTQVINEIAVLNKSQRPDMEILTEIQERLNWDALVDSGLVLVSVNKGNVTLSGTVGSAAEKRQAVSDAWIAGVKSVNADALKVDRWRRGDDLRKDKYTSKTPQAIQAAVKKSLSYHPQLAAFAVDVISNQEGLITLKGKVDNLHTKRTATVAARNTVGVNQVINELEVAPKKRWSDKDIAKNLMETLGQVSYLDREDLKVSVKDGVVLLTGEANNFFEKAKADELAGTIPGVIRVENKIVIPENSLPLVYDPYLYDWYVHDYEWYQIPTRSVTKSSAKPTKIYMKNSITDSQILKQIKEELWWSLYVNAEEVKIQVKDGVAILEGSVKSWMEYNAAAENALEGGASVVKNNLRVNHPSKK